MAQVSSWRQQIVNQISTATVAEFKQKTFKRFSRKRLRRTGGWLLCLTVVGAMVFWNWQLMLATGVGILVMLMVYLMQECDWQVHLSSLRRFLSGSNRQLTLAVGSGGVAAVSTYMTIAIWLESDSAWIATGAIVQGFGNLATLILVIWQVISRQANQEQANLNQIFANLTEADALKRMIAVRQLIDLVGSRQLESKQKQTIRDYFTLMLSREEETLIRDSILEGLQILEDSQRLNKLGQPLNLSISRQSTVKVQRRERIKDEV